MSLVNTVEFLTFLGAWELLSAEMENLLDQNDPEFLNFSKDTCNQVVAFDTERVDIGSFLQKLEAICVPAADSALHLFGLSALSAYHNWLAATGNGVGTQHIFGQCVYNTM
jgi:hypothetical protein